MEADTSVRPGIGDAAHAAGGIGDEPANAGRAGVGEAVRTATAAAPQASPQILAVQRALSEFGYGQIKTTGVYDADTRLAIQRFERDRRLPITGEMSDRVVRELAAITGRPLD